MRPVNLIPSEERSGERKPMRSGPLAYVVVGALAAAVLGVAMLAITGNQISESKAEIATLEGERATFEARAQALDAYTQFHTLQEQRLATVTSLADSRFDWERVMKELALVLPSDVWLTNLTGTASPGTSVEGAGAVSLRASVPGPALEMTGCASSHEALAGFVKAVKEIEGITRVGVPSSALGAAAGGGAASDSGTTSTCQTRDFITQFQMVAAFDAAPVPSMGSEGEAATPAAPAAETSTETTSE